ncbi:MAG: HD domain-containing protein [Bradymonadales bacterium]|nr:MAG: HD domain-containing protein [Bradymonadales bacterium]
MEPSAKVRSNSVGELGLEYYQVPSNLYQPGEKIDADLFLYYQGQYLLFRPKNFYWKKEDVTKLEGFGVKHLFIQCKNEQEHHQFLESNLTRIINEPRISNKEKSKILYEASATILEAIYKNPESSVSVKRSVKIVETSIDYLTKKENFFELMKMATADFSEYTHAIHTSAYSITLAREIGLKTYDELSSIGIGSILHDIGKAKIDRKILNKRGALTDDERREVEKHPMYGYELVRKASTLPELAEKIILMHHERPNGTGYPYRLSGDYLALAKVVAICDCFDSMTSHRPYQSAHSPVEALKLMQGKLSDEYDQNLLTSFIRMLAGK